MAPQLKDLPFNDFTLNGAEHASNGANFTLSTTDAVGYMSGSGGSATFNSIIDWTGSGETGEWHFYGVAENANKALGFMSTTGSNNYISFADCFEVPGYDWSAGSTATLAQMQGWIEAFKTAVGNFCLVKVEMPSEQTEE